MRTRLLIAAIVVLTTLMGAGPVAGQVEQPGGRFFDDNETVHEPNIEAIAAEGITAGCVGEGTAYCPENPVTREQMATFIARALDLPPGPNVFSDVNPSSPHAVNIAAIRQAGITLGCNSAGTEFCPLSPVTRAQMASFLVRAFDLAPRPIGPFDDVGGVHEESINAIAHEGITLGCNSTGTLFCPEKSVTRGQMASFLARGIDLEPVELLPRLKLTAVQSVCAGSNPVCSGTTGGLDTGDFYIQEGWFYTLPYSPGDAGRFASADFRLFIDGTEITTMVEVPTTDLFGTMVTLDGYLVTDLSAGAHTLVGEWWWDGSPAFTSVVLVTVSS